MNAWIHGTMGRKPAQPMILTASASRVLRAIAIPPRKPRDQDDEHRARRHEHEDRGKRHVVPDVEIESRATLSLKPSFRCLSNTMWLAGNMLEHVRTCSMIGWRAMVDVIGRRDLRALPLTMGGETRVPQITAVVSRFPRHELSIRRLYSRDATFREICEDYDEALRALRYWQSAATSSDPRIEQYRELVSELESEISGLVEGCERSAAG
jgi:hypothetical protein